MVSVSISDLDLLTISCLIPRASQMNPSCSDLLFPSTVNRHDPVPHIPAGIVLACCSTDRGIAYRPMILTSERISYSPDRFLMVSFVGADKQPCLFIASSSRDVDANLNGK
jgi:hypothetical protein